MKLGLITSPTVQGIEYASKVGLDYVEFCINQNEGEFFQQIDELHQTITKNRMGVFSVGRWGTERINAKGVILSELAISYALIDAASTLGAKVFIAGCNYVSEISYQQNIEYASKYFQLLVDYAGSKHIKVAVYNCRWNNFIVSPRIWDVMLPKVPGLGIKYDPSHAIYEGSDYLTELLDYADHIFHIHLKGSLVVNNARVDDPPAGLDMTDWKSFMAVLYYKEYRGGLSIEPHSHTWRDQLGDAGVRYSIDYFKPMLMEDK